MRGVRACALVFCAALALGCRIGGDVEVLPLRGAPPASVAIWPEVVAAEPSTSPTWFSGLSSSLAARGYRIVAAGVARQMLLDAGLSTALGDPVTVGRQLQVDAVLQLHVRAFDFTVNGGALATARWDLEWRLVSTRGFGVQWSFQHNGSWRQSDRAPDDPLRRFDQDPDARDIVPIGGNRAPGFRDVADLLAHLNRDAMQHLPEY